MTLFGKTVSTLEECEKALQAFNNDTILSTSATERLSKVRPVVGSLDGLRAVADKFKKNAEETDPAKKTYGSGMVLKVLAFYDRFVQASATAHEIEVMFVNLSSRSPIPFCPCSMATSRDRM
jgi:hypothetical protein